MSNEDLEIIPILDDVLVAGDLDKAITGDIDIKDLESIESFDALFEDSDTGANESSIDQVATEEIVSDESIGEENRYGAPDEIAYADNQTSDDDSFVSSIFSSEIDDQANDEVAEQLSLAEASSTEPVEITAYTDSEFESTDNTEMSDDNHGAVTNDHEEVQNLDSDFTSPTIRSYDDNQSQIDQTFDDSATEENLNEQDGFSAYETESSPAPEYDAEENFIAPAEPVDVNQIVGKVMQEIMPELETQIRSIVLAALEKNLNDSINTPPSEAETENDGTP